MTSAPILDFFVAGIPAPGGSKNAFAFVGKDGRAHARVVDAGKRNKPWRAAVRATALTEWRSPPLTRLLFVRFDFTMPRPKCHYGTGRHSDKLRHDAPFWHEKAPDCLKLARSTEDALTLVIWRDDCRNMGVMATKHYGEEPGCRVRIYLADDDATEKIIAFKDSIFNEFL